MDTIKEIINRFNLISKKSLGQNYILDENITNKIVKMVNVRNQIVFEIGPGPGCLTRSLINAGVKKIIAVEKDERCIKALKYQNKFFLNKLALIKGDVLKKETFVKIKKEFQKYKRKIFVVSNLPYNIATPILSLIFHNKIFFNDLLLMFQEEQANRIIAERKTKNYGRITILTKWLCNTRKKMYLSPKYFFPKPKVNSIILSFEFKKKIEKVHNENFFIEIIKKSFNQRRKIIKNSLKSKSVHLEKVLDQCNIRKNMRPEELTYQDFINLSNKLYVIKK